MDSKEIKDKFNKDGYMTIKNFLNQQETEELRLFMIKFDQTKQDKNDFIRKTETGKKILNRTILLLKEIFNKDYFYTGESSFSYDETTSARIWHRDSKATDFDNLDFTENHIIRFMFYFQDHENYSYGTKYIPGSHKRSLYRFWDYKFLF